MLSSSKSSHTNFGWGHRHRHAPYSLRHKLIQAHEDSSVFNHSLRSWLFGTVIIAFDPVYTSNTSPVDTKVHALGSILHDIGIASDFNGVEMPNTDHAAKGGAAVKKFMKDHAEA